MKTKVRKSKNPIFQIIESADCHIDMKQASKTSRIARTKGNSKICIFLVAMLLLPQIFCNGSKAKDSTATNSVQKGAASNQDLIHLLNRTSYGPAPGDLSRLKAIGVESYLQEQLNPQPTRVPETIKKLSTYDALSMSPAKLFLSYGKPALKAIAQKSGSDDPKEKQEFQKMMRDTYQRLYEESANARILRASQNPSQLEELMVDFWFNHFNISIDKNLDHLWVGSFEEKAIRPHAMGRFRDLLGATAHHAAMLFYLDNWQNTAAQNQPNAAAQRAGGRFKGINENYARELMELHTLGVDGGYTQKDVQELARVLTGLGLPPAAGGGFAMANRQQRRLAGRAENGQRLVNLDDPLGSYFDSRRHDYGDKTVVGYHIKGSGEAEIEQVLDILSRHPSTARHLSYKLAQFFVADKPSAGLVDKLSKTYLETDGNIRSVLNTLFHSSEFWDSSNQNAKFKSPYRFLVSSLRSTHAQVDRIQPALALLTQLGMPLYKCLTPDGYKNTKEAWLNQDNLINRLSFATAFGTGKYPGMRPTVYDSSQIADCIGPSLSDKTIDAVLKAPQQMRIALLLGSPEFMKY